MDPAVITSIATATVSLLVPYLKKAAEKASEEIGSQVANQAWRKSKELYEKLRVSLSSHKTATASLQNIIASPDNPQSQTKLIDTLIVVLKGNPTFALELKSLLIEAADAGVDTEFHTNIKGEVQKLVQIGTVHGNVNL